MSPVKYNIHGFVYKIQSVVTFLPKIKLDQGEWWNIYKCVTIQSIPALGNYQISSYKSMSEAF